MSLGPYSPGVQPHQGSPAPTSYPRIDINLTGVLRNFQVVSDLVAGHGSRLTVVTKGLTGYAPLVEALVEAGADSIGEAHLQTLQQYAGLPAEKWMIRPPLISQAAAVVRFADVSLNSELATIKALGRAAVAQGRVHRVVMMVDLGDTREGVRPEDLLAACQQANRIDGVELLGVGTEFGCLSDVVPSQPAFQELVSLVTEISSGLGRTVLVSGGSSNVLDLLQAGLLPDAVNHLRIGETILTGRVANFDTPLRGAVLDPFTLSAEIIEVKEKPSQPSGPRAPGHLPVADGPNYPDLGIRRRALVAIGKQDVNIRHLTPHDPDVVVLDGSSDIFVADVTDCSQTYKPGDVLTFAMDYYAILPAMISSFVEKRLIQESD